MCMGGSDNTGDGLGSQPVSTDCQGNPCSDGIRWGYLPQPSWAVSTATLGACPGHTRREVTGNPNPRRQQHPSPGCPRPRCPPPPHPLACPFHMPTLSRQKRHLQHHRHPPDSHRYPAAEPTAIAVSSVA